jgi:hypothetical protein
MDLIKDINTEVEEKTAADAAAAEEEAAQPTENQGKSVGDYFNDARNQSSDEK